MRPSRGPACGPAAAARAGRAAPIPAARACRGPRGGSPGNPIPHRNENPVFGALENLVRESEFSTAAQRHRLCAARRAGHDTGRERAEQRPGRRTAPGPPANAPCRPSRCRAGAGCACTSDISSAATLQRGVRGMAADRRCKARQRLQLAPALPHHAGVSMTRGSSHGMIQCRGAAGRRRRSCRRTPAAPAYFGDVRRRDQRCRRAPRTPRPSAGKPAEGTDAPRRLRGHLPEARDSRRRARPPQARRATFMPAARGRLADEVGVDPVVARLIHRVEDRRAAPGRSHCARPRRVSCRAPSCRATSLRERRFRRWRCPRYS